MARMQTIVFVLGSFDPNTFSDRIGIPATRVVRAGELRTPIIPYKEDIWRLTISDEPTLYVEPEADKLLAVFSPISIDFRTTVQSMGLRSQASFRVTMDEGESYPAIVLRPDQMKGLADLDMLLDVDIM